MASVSGIFTFSVVPSPMRLWMSTWPPIFSMFVFTTSMPTPRPEMFEICSAVEKPGRNTMRTTSWSDMRPAISAETRPRCTALARIRAGSIPAPSSVISMLICPPSW